MVVQVYSSMLQESIDGDGLLIELHPLAFAAIANSEETMNCHQAMNSPVADGFYKAMEAKLGISRSLGRRSDIRSKSNWSKCLTVHVGIQEKMISGWNRLEVEG